MSLQTYGLDQIAHNLVLVCRPKLPPEAPNLVYRSPDVRRAAYKMRTTVAYGLERFWGEHLRLGIDTDEGCYWKDVWDALATDLLQPAKIVLPNDVVVIKPVPKDASKATKNSIEQDNNRKIYTMADKLWKFAQQQPHNQRIALAVLTQLCDCLVWWTQRYK